MTIHNAIFPSMLKPGTKGGRVFQVDIMETMSGAEQRNLYHTDGRRVFTIEKGAVTEQQKDELVAFWLARKGKTYGFYYLEGPVGEFESNESDYDLIPVRFNMDTLDVEAAGPQHFVISGIELIEIIGEE